VWLGLIVGRDLFYDAAAGSNEKESDALHEHNMRDTIIFF